MIRSRPTRRGAKALIAIVAFATVAYGFASGPPAGHTGAPGEGTCVECHAGTLNSGPGSIVIEGVPDQYEPNQEVHVTVRVRHPNQSRWGFEITALDAANKGVGTFSLVDRNTTRITEGGGNLTGRFYVEHTTAGTFEGRSGGAMWELVWKAPAEDAGIVTFYAAGNAANGNNQNTGDSIYTTKVSSGTAVPVVVAPTYKKGKILLKAGGSSILQGARLEVTTAGGDGPEVFALAQNATGTKWVVKKKATSTPGELRVDDLLTPGTTVTLVVRNPDGTPSAPASLSR
jgi:hypothetical protein